MDRNLELIKLAQNGDEKACQTLINENMGLIWSVVKRFTGRGYENEDLFQVGSIGLIKCIKKFNSDFGVKFSTYAVPMIIGEIKRFIRDDGMIKVSRPLKEIAIKAKYMQDSILKKTGDSPTVNELAAALDIDVDELIMALDANKEVESLYSTVYQNDGSPIYLMDKVDKGDDSYENMLDKIVIDDIIEHLSPREQQIIKLRYFYDKTQVQVAEIVGISQVQVSRIEKKILKIMREKLV